ncbi:membrane cofactor protein-like isoform X1 [Carcharodon carcharias]|uniref:membrane cofactor protein-like isoform X1 n=1 Tax=Carcharodon carcharias TaxID=13397 RepID=UPI001B7E3395|nr:membrane cofactor protein-like isoform X1 [Carcharodon carcharias]
MAERLILALMAIWVARVTGDCSKPPHLENGSPTKKFTPETLFGVGTKVTYKCDLGYIFKKGLLKDSRSVTCNEDSTWTPLQAICEPRNCGNPGKILNGYYKVPYATFGSIVTFYCDTGYQMVGRSFRMCKADGWDGQVPTCEAITCGDLLPIMNGTTPSPRYGDHWEYGMIATYSCSNGNSLIGAEKLICTETGEWDNDPPTCKVVECQRPELPAYGKIEEGFGPTYKYRETISYICNEGFEMVGKSVIECKENNMFVPAPPTCKPVECHRPEMPANGRIEAGFGPRYGYQETISYVCNEGFEIVGKSVIECKEGNMFIPGPPTCKPRNCDNPGEILNGYYEAPNTTFETKATFYCNTGYRMVGSNYRLCKANGWDGQVPTCKVVECHLPELPANGRIESRFRSTYKYQENISYICDEGFEMVGKSVIECKENNTFIPAPPTCRKKKKPLIRKIEEIKQEPPPTNDDGDGLGTTGIVISCIIGICVGIGGAAGLSFYNKKRQRNICKKVHINPQPNENQSEVNLNEYHDHPV